MTIIWALFLFVDRYLALASFSGQSRLIVAPMTDTPEINYSFSSDIPGKHHINDNSIVIMSESEYTMPKSLGPILRGIVLIVKWRDNSKMLPELILLSCINF